MGADAGQLAVLDHQVLVANGLLVEEALQDLAHTRSVASLRETAVRGAIGLPEGEGVPEKASRQRKIWSRHTMSTALKQTTPALLLAGSHRMRVAAATAAAHLGGQGGAGRVRRHAVEGHGPPWVVLRTSTQSTAVHTKGTRARAYTHSHAGQRIRGDQRHKDVQTPKVAQRLPKKRACATRLRG